MYSKFHNTLHPSAGKGRSSETDSVQTWILKNFSAWQRQGLSASRAWLCCGLGVGKESLSQRGLPCRGHRGGVKMKATRASHSSSSTTFVFPSCLPTPVSPPVLIVVSLRLLRCLAVLLACIFALDQGKLNPCLDACSTPPRDR